MDREWTAFRFGVFFLSAAVHQNGLRGGSHPFRLWHFSLLFSQFPLRCVVFWEVWRCRSAWFQCLLTILPIQASTWELPLGNNELPNEKAGPKVARVRGIQSASEDISARLLDLEMRGAGGRISMSYYEYNKLSGIYCIKINRFERIKYLHSIFIWKHTCMKIHVLKLPFSFLCLSWPCIIIFPFKFPSIKFPTMARELSSIAQRAQQSKQALAVWASWFWKLQHPIWHPSGMPGVAWWVWMLCTWIIATKCVVVHNHGHSE